MTQDATTTDDFVPTRSNAFPEPTSAGRGARAVFVLAVICSSAICAAALVWWLWRMATGGSGYNSALTALYAFLHALLAGTGLILTRDQHDDRRRVRGARALAGFVMILTPLVYAELAMGLITPRVPVRETPYESDPEAEWRMKANYCGEYSGVPLQTNAEGFRSPAISLNKPVDAVRVVCLGDSLTFGHGVEERFAYPQIMQRVLQEQASGKRWELFNTGVEGYSTFQETAQLKRLLKYQPDLVVLLFCMNDVTEKYVRLRAYGGTGLGYQGVADGAAGQLFKALVAVREYSAIARYVTPSRDEAERRQAYAVMRLWREPDAPQIQSAWQQAEKELDELAAFCRAHSLGLLVAVAPFASQLDESGRADAPQRRLEKYAAARGIAYVDLWPEMDQWARRLGKRLQDLFLLRDRSHFNETGNQAIAEIIAARFVNPPTAPGNRTENWAAAVRRVRGDEMRETH